MARPLVIYFNCGINAPSSHLVFGDSRSFTATYYLTHCLRPLSLFPMNISLSNNQLRFTGPGGSLVIPKNDEVCRRLAMIIEGECEGLGASKAALKYDFSRQRYYQILSAFYAG